MPILQPVHYDDDPEKLEQKRRDFVRDCFSFEHFVEKYKELSEDDLIGLHSLLDSYHYQVMEKMKLFIHDNQSKISLDQWNSESHWIKEFSKDFDGYSHFGKPVRERKSKDKKQTKINKLFEEACKSKKIESIEFWYDFTDGDLGCTLNGKSTWIYLDQTIRFIYQFIEDNM